MQQGSCWEGFMKTMKQKCKIEFIWCQTYKKNFNDKNDEEFFDYDN